MTPEVQKHIEYASGYLDLKMYDDAMREADEALALAPNQPEAIGIKSDVLCQANRLQEAEPFMAQLAELIPSDSASSSSTASVARWLARTSSPSSAYSCRRSGESSLDI